MREKHTTDALLQLIDAEREKSKAMAERLAKVWGVANRMSAVLERFTLLDFCDDAEFTEFRLHVRLAEKYLAEMDELENGENANEH